MTAKEYSGEIKTVKFVFETEFSKMKPPFFQPIYVMHLVTRGGGSLSVEGEKHKITKGNIFFVFPGRFFKIEGGRDLEYACISFIGDGVPELFGHIGVTVEAPVYNGFEHIIEFRLSSPRRLEQGSANILESYEGRYDRGFSISKSCGFSDSLYFLKVFKKRVGCTQSDYINSLKNVK